MEKELHISVLKNEVLNALNPQVGDVVVDVTLGAGGHSEALLQKIGEEGELIAFDRDPEAIKIASKKIKTKNCTFINSKFSNLQEKLEEIGINKVDIILADLGVSSMQIDNGDRGFSFNHDGPLKMTMDANQKGNAEDLLNNASESELINIFTKFGEESFANSRLVAQAIVKQREVSKIETTSQLNDLLDNTLRASKKRPAIRIFQAIRIAINNELGEIEEFLPQAVDLLSKNGRVGVITFHSLEDKIVKKFFKKNSITCTCPPDVPFCVCNEIPKLSKVKKYQPSKEELEQNNRSRSAILRVATKN